MSHASIHAISLILSPLHLLNMMITLSMDLSLLCGVHAVATEVLLLNAETGEDLLVCMTGGIFVAEEAVHGFERDTLGLRNEEEDKDSRAKHERCEEEVHAEAHRGKHLRSESCDDEVPEPVVGCGERLCQSSHVLVEHLGI